MHQDHDLETGIGILWKQRKLLLECGRGGRREIRDIWGQTLRKHDIVPWQIFYVVHIPLKESAWAIQSSKHYIEFIPAQISLLSSIIQKHNSLEWNEECEKWNGMEWMYIIVKQNQLLETWLQMFIANMFLPTHQLNLTKFSNISHFKLSHLMLRDPEADAGSRGSTEDSFAYYCSCFRIIDRKPQRTVNVFSSAQNNPEQF